MVKFPYPVNDIIEADYKSIIEVLDYYLTYRIDYTGIRRVLNRYFVL